MITEKIQIDPHIWKIAGLMLTELHTSKGPVNRLINAGFDKYGNEKKIWVNDIKNPYWYSSLLSDFPSSYIIRGNPRWSGRRSKLNFSALNRTKVKYILRGFLRGYSYSRFASAVISYAEQLNREGYYGTQFPTPEEEIIDAKKNAFITSTSISY